MYINSVLDMMRTMLQYHNANNCHDQWMLTHQKQKFVYIFKRNRCGFHHDML